MAHQPWTFLHLDDANDYIALFIMVGVVLGVAALVSYNPEVPMARRRLAFLLGLLLASIVLSVPLSMNVDPIVGFVVAIGAAAIPSLLMR